MNRLLSSAAGGALLLLASCTLSSSSAGDPSLVIRGGTSFGFCVGYCYTELHLTPDTIVFVEKSRDPDAYPDRRRQESMSPEQWQRLVQQADFGVLSRLDDVYGCPDCADGGAEWIEMEQQGRRKRVTYEYNDTVTPIAALIDEIRQIRSRFTTDGDA